MVKETETRSFFVTQHFSVNNNVKVQNINFSVYAIQISYI